MNLSILLVYSNTYVLRSMTSSTKCFLSLLVVVATYVYKNLLRSICQIDGYCKFCGEFVVSP